MQQKCFFKKKKSGMSYSNPKACINAVLIEKNSVESTFFSETWPTPPPPSRQKRCWQLAEGKSLIIQPQGLGRAESRNSCGLCFTPGLVLCSCPGGLILLAEGRGHSDSDDGDGGGAEEDVVAVAADAEQDTPVCVFRSRSLIPYVLAFDAREAG